MLRRDSISKRKIRRQSSSQSVSPPGSPRGALEQQQQQQQQEEEQFAEFPLRRRTGFWSNPMNAVAIFTGSFAFAASLSMGMMNVESNRKSTTNSTRISKTGGDVWSRLLFGTPADNVKGSSSKKVSGAFADILKASRKSNKKDNATPILLMGLPKSGSEAIHKYFACNQVSSAHYCCDNKKSSLASTKVSESNKQSMIDAPMKFPCGPDQVICGSCVLENMQNNHPPFEGCGEYQVWSQYDVETSEPFSWFLPQHFALPLLHEAYPKAPIILNRRETALDWAESILHWHSVTTRLFESFDLELIQEKDLAPVPDKITYKSLMSDMQDSLNRVMSEEEWKRKRHLLIKAYNRHNQKIRQFASDYNHPLLEVVVDGDKEPGKQLEDSFHLSSACWQFNARQYDNDWKNFSLPF